MPPCGCTLVLCCAAATRSSRSCHPRHSSSHTAPVITGPVLFSSCRPWRTQRFSTREGRLGICDCAESSRRSPLHRKIRNWCGTPNLKPYECTQDQKKGCIKTNVNTHNARAESSDIWRKTVSTVAICSTNLGSRCIYIPINVCMMFVSKSLEPAAL